MRRGDIWTVAGGKDYAGKARPVVVVQDDSFDATDSITVCAFTADETDAPLFRLPVEPNERNGLRVACRLMVDKITTVSKSKVGARVYAPDEEAAEARAIEEFKIDTHQRRRLVVREQE
jgi:mRNA interferase MazF